MVELEMLSKGEISINKSLNELTAQIGNMRKEILQIVSKQSAFAQSIKLLDEKICLIIQNQEEVNKAEEESGNDSDRTTKTARTNLTARSIRSSARNVLKLKDCEEKAKTIPSFVNKNLMNFDDLQEIQYKYFLFNNI